jgi:hypothetical protein
MRAVGVAFAAVCLLGCNPQQQGATVHLTGKATQIVAQWPDGAPLEKLFAIEDAIENAASDIADIDGHDVGSGTFNVFLYTDDSTIDATVARLVKLVEGGKVPPGMKVGVAQYTNAARTDWTFKPVYPAGLTTFDIT